MMKKRVFSINGARTAVYQHERKKGRKKERKKEKNVDLDLVFFTKMNSKWIILKCKTIKLLEDKSKN